MSFARRDGQFVLLLCSVFDNYQVLLDVWDESKESPLDSEIMARIIGVEAQMFTFDFPFGVTFGALILNHGDNLSKSLQQMTSSASEGQYLAKLDLLGKRFKIGIETYS